MPTNKLKALPKLAKKEENIKIKAISFKLRFRQQFTYKPRLPYSTKDHVSHDDIHQNSYIYEPRNSPALSHH